MTFSYSAIWDDCVRLLKSHGSLLIAVAGAFLLLPELLISYFYPRPEPATIAQMITLGSAYIEAHWPILLLASLVSSAGAVTMLLLLLDRAAPTVGGAIRASLPLLVTYVLVGFLTNLLVLTGTLLLILPGLYLIGRTVVAGAALAAERRRNPIDALRRSFELTRRRGWAVFGLFAVIFLAGTLVVFASSRVLGAIFLLTAGQKLGGLLTLILDSALGAGMTTIMLVLAAAIYRRLTAPS